MTSLHHRRGPAALRAAAAAAAAALALGLAACAPAEEAPDDSGALIDDARCEANREAGTITYINSFGFGRPELFAAQELGYFDAMCLDVELITDTQNSISYVSTGRGTMGSVGDAGGVITYAAGGANITAVATMANGSAYVILTKPEITELTQLEGRTIGYHTKLPEVLQSTLIAAGVDTEQVEWINDTTYDPTLLITGQLDAIQAYRNNEPINLTRQGYDYNMFLPEDFGVHGTMNVYIANTEFLAEHRTAVQDFLRAAFKGVEYCAADIEACIEIIASEAEAAGQVYDREHQAESWMITNGIIKDNPWQGGGVGVQGVEQFEPEAEMVVAAGLVDEADIPDLAELVDEDIAAELYDGTTLLWPEED